MGCDIHVTLERYNKESKRWEPLNLYKKNPDDTFEPIPVYDGRNYELFGLLAGVRGSSHFFKGGYGYIVEPRGLPEDMSSYAQFKWEEGKDEDGRVWWHTPTWYDFCELENYAYLLDDFNKTIKGKNKEIEELEKKVKHLENRSDEQVFWQDELDDLCEEYEFDYNGIDSLVGFVSDIKNVLYEYHVLCPKMGDVRVVLWFDN